MKPNDDRTPPSRIRTTGLQEAQLPELIQTDALCAAMYHEIGFDAAEVPMRGEHDFAMLTRNHNVRVAEADHVPAGFLAWRDESPGVAYLADVSVHPDYQRFGIATRLLEVMEDEARELRLHEMVVRCWEKATWAMAFYKRHGFSPIDDSAPPKVRGWRDERSHGRPLTRPGEVALWAPIKPKPVLEEDEPEEEDTLVTGSRRGEG
ncbi:MAG: GNAT family N-acetyltransferase [Byssovorax sp.]